MRIADQVRHLASKPGVYIIKNKSSGKMYVGSSNNIYNRACIHISMLNNRKHYNPQLQVDWLKDDFVIKVLRYCDNTTAHVYEQKFIRKYRSTGNLYNTLTFNICPKVERRHIRSFHRSYVVDENGCHVWQGSKNGQGYGSIQINWKKHQAHRVAYYLHHRRWPSFLFIRHMCNNKSCVNPLHMKIGTPHENSLDYYPRSKPKYKQKLRKLTYLCDSPQDLFPTLYLSMGRYFRLIPNLAVMIN